MIKKIWVLIFGISFIVPAFSQNNDLSREEKKKFKEAKELYDEGDFLEALPLFEELWEKYPDATNFKYRTGICYMYLPEKRKDAVKLLEEVHETDTVFLEAYYYLGTAYHLNYQFDEAVKHLEYYKENAENLIGNEEMMVEKYLKYSRNGKIIMRSIKNIEIKNIGAPICTEGGEYVPLIAPDESMMVYTYSGENSKGGLQKEGDEEIYKEDIMVTYKEGESWSAPQNISDSINTDEHDAAVSLSVDGQWLFVYKSDEESKEDIYVCERMGDDWSAPKRLEGDVNSSHWEGSASLSPDGKTLYFASDRPGGKGGRDLYKSVRQPDGTWGKAENLGFNINTPYNEDAPFMHPDGKTLYFSTEWRMSIGGYDIFYSTLGENGYWSAPVSMGYPLNTVDDDRYYVVSADGKKGYFSSERVGGKGKHDIYYVVPGAEEEPQLILARGTVYLDDEPTAAEIKLVDIENGVVEGEYSSNSETGEFTFPITPSNNYHVKVDVEGLDSYYVEEVVVDSMENYEELSYDFYLYSDPDLAAENKDKQQLQDVINEKLGLVAAADTAVSEDTIPEEKEEPEEVVEATSEEQPEESPCSKTVDLSEFKDLDFAEKENYERIVAVAGDICREGLEFKVQVAAYENPENYDYSHLSGFGAPETNRYGDGITRFTMGNFDTLGAANELKEKIVNAGQDDAFVTIFYNGDRITIERLVNEVF